MTVFVCGLSLPSPSARAEFAALIFDGVDKSESQVQHLQAMPNGQMRATHSLAPVKSVTGGSFSYKGQSFDLRPDMSTTGACHFYMNLLSRKITSEEKMMRDLLHYNSLPPRRAVTLADGEWVSLQELKNLYDQDHSKAELFPTMVAVRLKEGPQILSEEEAMRVWLQKQEAFEFLVPRNLLTVAYGQKIGSEGKLVREKMPWQYYGGLFDHNIPEGAVAFEMGKASARKQRNFPKLMNAAAFAALKEASDWGKSLNESYVYVHATDEPHLRLYKSWGFDVVAEGKTDPTQNLMRATLSKLLESSKFDPAKFSERIALAQAHSELPLSDQVAYVLGKTLQDMMSLRLDVAVNGKASTVRIDDRSPIFFDAADALMGAHGIRGAQADQYKAGLSQITRAHYIKDKKLLDSSHVPEEFNPNQIEGNVFIQELDQNLAKEDKNYLAKVFAGVTDWYVSRNQPFANFTSPQVQFGLVFSAMTRSMEIVSQAQSLGFSVRKVALREIQMTSHTGVVRQETSGAEIYSISAPLAHIQQSLQSFRGGLKVEQGKAALKAQQEQPLSD